MKQTTICLVAALVGAAACLAVAAPAGQQEVKEHIYKVDQELVDLEKQFGSTIQRLYYSQLKIADGINRKNPTGAIGLRAIAYRLARAEMTKKFIMEKVLSAMKDLLFSHRDQKLDGSLKLGKHLQFDGPMIEALLARSKVRAAMDGFLFSGEDWKYIYRYIQRYGFEKPSGPEVKSLVNEAFDRLKQERQMVDSFQGEQSRAVAAYKSSHDGGSDEKDIIAELDKLIDEWMGCPLCVQNHDEEEDEEIGQAYPMFMRASEVEQGLAKSADKSLQKSLAKLESSFAKSVVKVSRNELEEVDLGEIDELVFKVQNAE